MFVRKLYILLKVSNYYMVTIEDIVSSLDKPDFEKRVLGCLRLDLARVGFYETYVKPQGLSHEEGHEKLVKAAESILDYFYIRIYESIKHQTKKQVKGTEFPKSKKEYEHVRDAATEAFKKFSQEHIAKTFVVYHFYRNVLKYM